MCVFAEVHISQDEEAGILQGNAYAYVTLKHVVISFLQLQWGTEWINAVPPERKLKRVELQHGKFSQPSDRFSSVQIHIQPDLR